MLTAASIPIDTSNAAVKVIAVMVVISTVSEPAGVIVLVLLTLQMLLSPELLPFPYREYY